MAKIEVNNLTYTRARFSLELASLRIEPGEKVALMGENGCGKSTLLNLMTGLIEPPRNTVSYRGKELQQIRHGERARLFAVLPQFSDISFPFSVFEVALLGRYVHMTGTDFSEEDKAKTLALMELMDIARYKDHSYAELSGGEKRRVMLARVLNQEAPVIYLDEPNSSLDIRHTLEIFHHLHQLPQTVITSVHDINLAHRYFDRFLFFKQGKLLHDVRREGVTANLLSEVYDVSVTTNTDSFSFRP
ncbi:ABC transporter ATP-binding protein [Photobacterium lipolyticum]|uniref:ABC transporter ATP-binding protein n=1 Tax=Photobacterium lipolyticum TaxID=266810 RepID=A0A2T3N2T5_9GAMM|nr:ABC transporter ATP-binding protein [Photobacterium lipolyticum]PSW06595.1 ABC transporter ATP-binding protein [Photobacterium lipolyticum]